MSLKTDLHQKRHFLIPYGIPLLLLAAAYAFFISPVLRELDELDFIADQHSADIVKFKKLLRNEKLFKEDIARSQKLLEQTRTHLQQGGGKEQCIKDVLAQAKSHGIGIVSLESGNLTPGESVDEFSLKLGIEGGYKSLLEFTRALECSVPPIRIAHFSIRTAENKKLTANFQLIALVRHETE